MKIAVFFTCFLACSCSDLATRESARAKTDPGRVNVEVEGRLNGNAQAQKPNYKVVDRPFMRDHRSLGEAWLSNSGASVGSFLCATSTSGGTKLIVVDDMLISMPEMLSARLPAADGEIKYCNWSRSGRFAVLGSTTSSFLFDCVKWDFVRKISGAVAAWFRDDNLYTVRLRKSAGADKEVQVYDLFVGESRVLTAPAGWIVQATTPDGADWLVSNSEIHNDTSTFAVWQFNGRSLVTQFTFASVSPNYSQYGMSLFDIGSNRFLASLGGGTGRNLAVPWILRTAEKTALWDDPRPQVQGQTTSDYFLAPAALVGSTVVVPTVTVATGTEAPRESYSLRKLLRRGGGFTSVSAEAAECVVAISYSNLSQEGCAIVWRKDGYYAMLIARAH